MLNRLFEDVDALLLEKQNYETMFDPWIRACEFVDKNLYQRPDANFQIPIEKFKKRAYEASERARKMCKRVDFVTWYLLRRRITVCADFFYEISGIGVETPANKEAIEILNTALKRMLDKLIEQDGSLAASSSIGIQPNNFDDMKSGPIIQSYDANVSHFDRQIEHYGSLMWHPLMQQYRFQKGSTSRVLKDLEDIDEKIKEAASGTIPESELEPNIKLLKDFKDGFAWYDLGTPVSRVEANAMGHCCNDPRTNDGGTVYSLRRKIKEGDQFLYKPHVTFMVKDTQGFEIKGRGNAKPIEKYHPYLVWLLQSKYITELVGGGYAPENNFSVLDLDEGTRNRLIEKKPGLLTISETVEQFGKDSEQARTRVKTFIDGSDNGLIGKGDLYLFESNGVFQNSSDFIESLGNDTAKYVMNLINGDNYMDIDYMAGEDHFHFDDALEWIEDDLKEDLRKYLFEELKDDFESYNEEYEEYSDDTVWDTKTLARAIVDVEKYSSNSHFIDLISRGLLEGDNIGAESEATGTLFKAMENLFKGETFECSVDGVWEIDVSLKYFKPVKKETKKNSNGKEVKPTLTIKDVDKIIDNPKDGYFWDTPIALVANLDSITKLVLDGFFDEYDEIIPYPRSESFEIQQPYYGWSGFDESAAKERINEILSDEL